MNCKKTALTTNCREADEMMPLWLAYPDIRRGSIGWRMGDSEDYMCEWRAWYKGLSPAGKKSYREMYPEPGGWKGFYKNLDG